MDDVPSQLEVVEYVVPSVSRMEIVALVIEAPLGTYESQVMTTPRPSDDSVV